MIARVRAEDTSRWERNRAGPVFAKVSRQRVGVSATAVDSARPAGEQRVFRGLADGDELAVADTAVAAAFDAAVGGRLAPLRFFVFVQEKFPVEPRVDKIPRQGLPGSPFTQVLLETDSPFPEGLLPELEPELIAPAVETGAEPPGALHQVREPLIAPREEPLQEAHPGVVPLEADVAVFHAPLEVGLFRQGLLETDLADPLEGRVGLGDQGRKAEGDLPSAPFPHDTVCQVGNPLQVLLLLAGQADHEVELDGFPAPLVDAPGRGDQILLGVSLVDDRPAGAGSRPRGQW